MNLVSRNGSRTVIRQVPILLLLIAGLFSLPFLGFSLSLILSGKEADGKYFCLFLGLGVLWVFLEFVATRERIDIDSESSLLKRSIEGVFRHKQQVVELVGLTGIAWESRLESTGTKRVRRQYLYMDGRGERFLMNSPAKVYLDQRKLGKILHEVTRIPYRELIDGKEASVIAVLVGCAMLLTSGATANARTMVYISNADSREIYVLELNEKDGSSKAVEKVQVAGSVMPLAISPDHKHLYASLRSEPYSVSSFAIDQVSGRLTALQTVPLADNMAYLSMDRSGRYLFGASYFGNKISVNVINPEGEVSPVALRVIATGKNAHCIGVDPSNKFLFASNLGSDVILQYRFDEASGTIAPNEPPAVETRRGSGPRHFVFHPNRRLLFCTNELDGTVNAYRLEATGTLTPLDSTSVMPPDFPGGAPATADIHLTPDGKFLYASERTSSTLAAFRVNGDSGKLTLIGSYPTETQPRAFNIDPDGKYLLAVGQKSNGLSIYEIDQETGTLQKLSHQDTGKNPNWVEIIALP